MIASCSSRWPPRRAACSAPSTIRAASPRIAGHGHAGSANTGTVTIVSLEVRSPIPAPGTSSSASTRTRSAAPPVYQISADGGTSYGAAQPLVAGQPISLVDGSGNVLWSLAVSGTPSVGDGSIDPTAVPAESNGNALAMLGRRDAALVRGDTSPTPGPGRCRTSASRVQGAQGAADLSASIAADAEARNTLGHRRQPRRGSSGLIQYQQSYQAAAQMLQVAQTVFDSLLQATGS